MIDVIIDFLANKKEEFLQKKIASELKGKKNQDDDAIVKARAKFQVEADEKYQISSWLDKVIAKAKPNITTHPAKFTNPKIKDVSANIFIGKYIKDGYLKTGNVNLTDSVDVSGDAATNTIIFELYQLLSQKINGDKRFISLFESDNDELKNFIGRLSLDYQKLKEKSLAVFFGNEKSQTTHELIRQVYFPVDEENYHLLSVTTPSMLLFDVKNRIDAFDKWIEGSHIRNLKKDNLFHDEGFDELLNITEIGFSHNEFTKMGNVSYLNVKNKGIAYLLPSTPPTLQKRDIRLPTYDFFKNSLRLGQFKESFVSLHKLTVLDINNINIREGINNLIKFVIDQVLQKAFAIRAYGIGWSSSEYYQSLPLAQRIWLDDVHEEQRQNNDDWRNSIGQQFAAWIVQSYEASLKNSNATMLSSAELSHIRQFIDEAISQDKEFF